MKKLLCLSLFLLSVLITKAQVAVTTSASGLAIRQDGVVRITNGIGRANGVEDGEITHTVKNNVVLLKLHTSKLVAPLQSAGVFFDDLPQLKQGITNLGIVGQNLLR